MRKEEETGEPVSDCCGASALLAEGLMDSGICPDCGEHCEWVREGEDPDSSPPPPEIEDLGWANGWKNSMPEKVERCLRARHAGEKHDCGESPGPWSCTHVFECRTCGYKYMYDSGD